MQPERTRARTPPIAEKRSVVSRMPVPTAMPSTSALQQRLGNRGTQLFATQAVARSYTISQPDDASEREADRIAEAVVRDPGDAAAVAPAERTGIRIDRSSDANAAQPAVDGATAGSIGAMRGTGAPLPGPTRAFFESRLSADLGHVRVHTSTHAADAATALHARAFTVG